MKPSLTLITGTNGAGKSTFGNIFFKQENIPFIDIDLFYKEKFGEYREYSNEEKKIASQELKNIQTKYFTQGQSFLKELIIDTPTIKYQIELAKQYNFQISLIYIGIDGDNYDECIEKSKKRINDRIIKGFHYVEPETIKINLINVVTNFKKVASLFDNIFIYDNTNFYDLLLDMRNKEICKAKELPNFAKQLISHTFIEEKIKSFYFNPNSSSALDSIKAEELAKSQSIKSDKSKIKETIKSHNKNKK